MSSIELEPVVVDEFEAWLNERPRWLQTAAKMLIDKKRTLDSLEIDELARLCQVEAKGQPDPGFIKITPGAFAQAAVRPQLRIEEISEVYGVNAIRPSAGLPLGQHNLTVIYGQNGTGKSGFARLLKQVCGSRSKDDIHCNVFEETPTACSAKFKLSVNGKSSDVDWDISSGPHKALRHAQVFDSKAAMQYMGRAEASYEPSRMKFVTALIVTADAVSAELGKAKFALPRALPMLPSDLVGTAESRWLGALKPTTTPANLDKECLFDDKLDQERIQSEALLAEKDVAGRLTAIGKEQGALLRIKTILSNLKAGTTDDCAAELFQLKEQSQAARRISEEAAQKVFGDTELEGVGTPTWQGMWEQARLYSTIVAYEGQPFPVATDEARCVLCHQKLDDDTQKRLVNFEKFVTDGLETAAKTAEKALADRIKTMPVLPSRADWLVHLSTLGFEDASSGQWFDDLAERHKQIAERQPVAKLKAVDWASIESNETTKSATLLTEETSLKALLNDEQRQKMESRLLQLRAKQWLSQNKIAIDEERLRLIAVAALDKAIKSAATNALTTKKNELGKTELDAGYQQRFAEELKFLGGNRIPVRPESKPQGKGKITFGLTLVKAFGKQLPEAILSEGEARIVALAAFLADTTGSNQLAPFIFDDPISSLDQDFEERVVERLATLAKTRQVIIFTHRLSLVALVESVLSRWANNGTTPKINHTLVSLRRLDKLSGIVAAQSARDLKPEKALNNMSIQTLARLRKHQAQGEVDDYDMLAKTSCSDFRIIVEKTVEFILLADVVGRFRRDINTRGKLQRVAKITTADCNLIDDLMTRYSVFEHAQSDEMPSVPLELAVFEADVAALSAWIVEFQARA
ncbi:AAA family ATPase [Pseudomonas sp. GV085]|uniref:AAA family ATPase n=1 Tax=Pseudomonas sp. GV085 TaxID=2135756 RepID=UPI000D3C1014|nr:AAA family ATPase [Pseudomonas sp. GV085]PTR27910.1 hypothetical protein C8K63_102135 [Pseudomonas sp. GV085]